MESPSATSQSPPPQPLPPPGPLSDVFDVGHFQGIARTAVDHLTAHLSDRSIRGLELIEPAVLTEAARALMTTERGRIAPFDPERLAAILDLFARTGIQVHSPGYMGRQFSGVVPLAGVVEFVSSVLNQPSSFYEAAQLPCVAERIMAEELGRFIGWAPESFAMVTTSGGSLGNLTALLAARNKAFPEYWSKGAALTGPGRPAIAVGADVHYSVTRAAGILGIGEAQIIRLPLNRDGQICLKQVRPTLRAAAYEGLKPFCLVASAGTTSFGAFDPIDALGELAREEGLWLHVDGAHGASLLVSDELRGRLKGIEQADSLVWDAHKMMFVPAPCTLLFYRRKTDSALAFRQHASYVFDEEPDLYTALDSGHLNLETTKRPMIMALWAMWAVYGRALFAEKIEHLCRTTREAHRILLGEPDFETVHHPESNILCFRYRPAELAQADVHRFQIAIRDKVKRRGTFFISKVDLSGVAALRVVLMNHRIASEHVRMLLDEIRQVGDEILATDGSRAVPMTERSV